MYKKMLCLVVVFLGLSSVTLAADDFGGNGGSGNDYSAGSDAGGSSAGSSFVGSNAAYSPGIYLGGQFGTTNMHYRGSEYTSATSSYDDKYQFAGRGYLGYAFSQFISTELGYTYYGRPKFWNTQNNNTQDILQQGMDLMVKANLPLDYGFGVYMKAGMAWVSRGTLHSNGVTFVEKESNSKFPPIGALGVNYWFAPNIALDLCWTKTMHVSSLPTIDLFTIGFIYKINI